MSKQSKRNEDLRIPTTPHKLAKAALNGGATRQRKAKKAS